MIKHLNHKFVLVLSLVMACFLYTPAHAQQAAIDRGQSWLLSVQQPDGTWTADDRKYVDTFAALETLLLLNPQHVQTSLGLDWLRSQMFNTTDDLAHRVLLLSLAGDSVLSDMTVLRSYQQADGGWGADLDFFSDVLDTVLVLQALTAAGDVNTTTASNALSYLLSVQNSDGGWGAARGQPSEVFYTALGLLALKDYQTTFNLNAPIAGASNYLTGRQNADGSFGSPSGTAFETALALQAMLRFVVDPAKRSNAVNDLTSTQAANSSWADDVYSTVLAALDGDGVTEQQGGGKSASRASTALQR